VTGTIALLCSGFREAGAVEVKPAVTRFNTQCRNTLRINGLSFRSIHGAPGPGIAG
jgi:hypothetical protein